MAAKDHLNSDQYITVYRGLSGIDHPDALDPELIGPHWTHDKSVAENFAGKTGSIITGRVNRKHVMQDSSTGWSHPDLTNDYGMGYDTIYKVFPDEEEKETFIRPNRRVYVTHMETSPNNKIRDKWQFDPPLKRNSEKLYAYSAEEDGGDISEWYKGES